MKLFLILTNLANLGVYLYSFSTASAEGLLISTSAAFAGTILLSLALLRGGNNAAFSPLTVLLLVHLYANVVRINLLAIDPSLMEMKYYLEPLTNELINDASMLVLSGTLSIVVGYLIVTLFQIRIPSEFQPARISWVGAYAIFASCLVLTAMLISQTNFSDSFSAKRIFIDEDGQVFTFGPVRFALQIILAAVQILLVYFFMKIKDNRLNAVIAISLLIIVSFALSKRSFLLFALLPLLLLGLQNLNIRRGVQLSMVAIVIIPSILGVTYLRSSAALERFNTGDSFAEEVKNIAVFTVISANYGGVVPTVISTYLIEDQLDEPFYGRSYFIDPLAQFVPRTIWSEKPEELGGRIRKIFQATNLLNPNVIGGVPPGVFAEAWLNFRTGGVIFVSLVYGMVLGAIYRASWRAYTTNPAKFALLLIIGINTVLFVYGGHTARGFNMLVQALLAYSIIMFLSGNPVSQLYPHFGHGRSIRS